MTPDQYRSFIKEVLPPMGYRWRRFDRRNTRRKIQRRMEHLGIHEPDAYAATISGSPEEARLFESLLPVTITRFYRNAWLWEELGLRLSEAVNAPGRGVKTLRVWSAGCGGGEEAFTAAMVLDDLRVRDISDCSWSVLGTDIDGPSLERSSNLKYSWGAVREVPPSIRRRWFSEVNDTWTLDVKIHDFVEIHFHDTVREDPPGIFHAVLLRNSVLTYNSEKIQREVLRKIRRCLVEPGLLVIGRTENLAEGTGFEKVGRCIYRGV